MTTGFRTSDGTIIRAGLLVETHDRWTGRVVDEVRGTSGWFNVSGSLNQYGMYDGSRLRAVKENER